MKHQFHARIRGRKVVCYECGRPKETKEHQLNTPREDADIDTAIKAAEAKKPKGTSLYASTIQMGELYMALKNMGVDKENILDLIRIPFMFASVPDKPQMVSDTLANIDAKRKDN